MHISGRWRYEVVIHLYEEDSKRESELIKSVSVALRFIRSSRGLGAQDVQLTSALHGLEWNGDFPNKQKCAGYILGH